MESWARPVRGCFVAAALLAAPVVVRSADSAAPVANSGFELEKNGGPAAWTCTSWSGADAVCELDGAVSRSGARGVRIKALKEATFWLQQELTLKPNTEYGLRAWCKGQDIETDSDGGAYVYLYEGKSYDKCVARLGPFKGTFDWTGRNPMGNDQIVFRTGGGSCYTLRPVLYKAKAGSVVWFDDVTVTEFSPSSQSADFPLRAVIMPVDWQDGRTYHFIDNTPNLLVFNYIGNKERIKEPRLILELPKEIELDGAVYMQAGRKWLPMRREDGADFVRHEITISGGITSLLSPEQLAWRTADILFVTPRACVGKQFEVRWYFENAGVRGPVSTFKAEILPAVEPGQSPERFRLEACRIPAWICPDPLLRERFLKLYQTIGIVGQTCDDQGAADEILSLETRHGWRNSIFWGWNGEAWADRLSAKYGANWEQRLTAEEGSFLLVDAKGAIDKNYFCPGYLAGKGKLFYEEYRQTLTECLNKYKPQDFKIFIYDWEPDQYSPNKGCFCARCLKAFAEKNGVGLEALTVERLLNAYKDKWAVFCHEQVAEIVRHSCELVKQADPTLEVRICSGYFPQKEWKGVAPCQFGSNPILFDQLSAVDGHEPMIYVSGAAFYDNVETMTRNLRKPVWPIIAVNERFPQTVMRYSANRVRQCMLASVVNGARGLSLWAYLPEDGLYLREIARAKEEIAVVESMIFAGERADSQAIVKTLPRHSGESGQFRHKTHSHDGRLLLSLFNYDAKKDEYIRIALPALEQGRFLVYDPIAGAALSRKGSLAWRSEDLRDGFIYSVKHGDVSFLIVRPYGFWERLCDLFGTGGTVEVEDITQAYERETGGKENPAPPAVGADGLSARWDVIDQDGTEGVVLETAQEKVRINPWRGGQLWGWTLKKDGTELVNQSFRGGEQGGGACFDLFWHPQGAVWSGLERSEYQVRSCNASGACASACLQTKNADGKPERLTIAKSYGLSSGSPGLEVTYQMTNEDVVEREFGFWSHNLLMPGPVQITVPLKSGGLTFTPTESNYVFSAPGVDDDFLASFRKGELAENWISLAGANGKTIKITTEFDKLSQLYFWHNGVDTCEWMYKKVRLKPGETWQTKFKLEGG